MLILKIISYITFLSHSLCVRATKINEYGSFRDADSPAFVTPLINKGDIDGAQKLTYVKPMKGDISSHAGFFTVENTTKCQSNMFFWFFPSRSGPSSAPIVLSLQGGAGDSSLVTVFEENGPFYVKPKRGLKLRKYTWIQTVSVIYIDNPVGTGFSFTSNDTCYAQNNGDVAQYLTIALRQFFTLFPQYQKNDFFIWGESYAAKYVPALALNIDKSNNNRNALKINLKGISLGNGFHDPENMVAYGDYLYQIGLIDMSGLSVFKKMESTIVSNIRNKQYVMAFNNFDILINGDLTPYKTMFNNLTGLSNYFNYWYFDKFTPYGNLEKFIQSELARTALHVGNTKFNTDYTKVQKYLLNDYMQSVKPLIETVLNKKYRVLIYSGQLDIIVPYQSTINFIRKLNWSGSSKYAGAGRQKFVLNNNVVGYFKKADNLIEFLIRDAGHMVSKDQPLWALELIRRFTYNKPFV